MRRSRLQEHGSEVLKREVGAGLNEVLELRGGRSSRRCKRGRSSDSISSKLKREVGAGAGAGTGLKRLKLQEHDLKC